jgi:hypothetical protein
LPQTQTFFVSTDNTSTVSHLQEALGPHRVFFLRASCSDRSLTCVRTALADLLLLSQTKSIIGSFWSSYSEVAQLLGRKKDFSFACGESCPQERIRLIIQFPVFPTRTLLAKQRQDEFVKVLQQNIKHADIESIHVLHESRESMAFLQAARVDDPCSKLDHQLLGRRLAYKDVFAFGMNVTNVVYAYANADIIMGKGFNEIAAASLPVNEVLALTRYEANSSCGIDLCPLYKNAKDGYLSHDTYVWHSNTTFSARFLAAVDYVPNQSGAENVLVHELKKDGKVVSNPCVSVTTYHSHCSHMRGDNSTSWKREDNRLDLARCNNTYNCGDGYVIEGPTTFVQRWANKGKERTA